MTITYPGAAKVTQEDTGALKVQVGSRPRAYYSRGATQRLVQGEQEVAVVFATPLKDANWVFGALTFWNTADAAIDTVHLQAMGISAKSQNGFTIRLNGVPPTDNYYLDWTIAEAFNP